MEAEGKKKNIGNKMEPGVILMGRGTECDKLSALKIDTKERHPGDGMEAHVFDKHSNLNLSPLSYKKSCMARKNLKSPKLPRINAKNNKNNHEKKRKKSKNEVHSYSMNDLTKERTDEHFETSHKDLTILVDSLKTRLKLVEDHNNQLVEEKMRLSHQLGVQTQVNNELKKLLVASIGEDLQNKYERMIQDKYLAELELKHLHSVLEDDREEVEQAMIQADVWRSKFLASRVMSDELSRWKSALYYKYRETHTALQTLLEEHSKIRALNNATKRGLVNVVELLECKDPSLDVETTLTTIDVAFMNNDLVESIFEIMSENIPRTLQPELVDNTNEKIKGENILKTDLTFSTNQLTPAEDLAQKVVLNPGLQTEELIRMRRDYLAHNRISHFLSTNYQVTFNCCENCRGGTLVLI